MSRTMNEHEIAEELVRRHGYTVRGLLPSGWVLVAPDKRLVRERDLDKELERITAPREEKS